MNTSERPFRVCHLGCQAHKGTEPSEHQSIFQQGWQNEQGAEHSPQQGSFLPPIPFSQDSDSSRQVLHPQKRALHWSAAPSAAWGHQHHRDPPGSTSPDWLFAGKGLPKLHLLPDGDSALLICPAQGTGSADGSTKPSVIPISPWPFSGGFLH